MRKYLGSLVVLLVVFSVAGPADAQEKGQVGVTMAFPASVGVIFHPTDAIAARPDFTFSTTSTDTTNPSSLSTSSSSIVGFGASALFYVRTWEHLRAYVSPRFGYSRSTTHFSGTSSTTTSTSESTSNIYSGSGSVGAQYALSRRFGVFAETGLAISWQRNSGSGTATATLPPVGAITSSSTSSGHTWSTRAGVGAILYF